MTTLNDRITTAFENYSPQAACRWQAVSPIYYSRSLHEDLMAVNRFLRIQLGLLDVDTTTERQYLCNDCDLQEWLEGFEDVVLPTIMDYGLPIWTMLEADCQ